MESKLLLISNLLLGEKSCAQARRIWIHFWRIPLWILCEIQAKTIGTRFARPACWLQKNRLVRCWCVYCTKLEPISKITDYWIPSRRSVHSTEHRKVFGSVPAPSLRPRLATTHSILFGAIPFFFFFGMVVAGEVGVLPREKMTEFKCGLGFAKLFSGDLDLAKPRRIFPPAERGLGNECGRVLRFKNCQD